MPTNTQYREKDGFTIIGSATKDEGQIVASQSAIVLTTPRKIAVENISDRVMGGSPFTGLVMRRRQNGTSDGVSYERIADDPNGTISKPWGLDTDDITGVLTGAPTAVVSLSPYGVWGATGTYGVVITALNAVGETIASVEKTFVISFLTDTVFIDWAVVPGATHYRVYVTDEPGVYGAYTLVDDTVLTSFTYDGTPPTAGTPPLDNTTGGAAPNYGVDPVDGSFGTADLTIAVAPAGLAVGQQWFFYFRERLPAAASSTGNKRVADLAPTEI